MKNVIKLSLAIFMCTLALIVVSTVIKVMDRHNISLLHVTSKRIEESARKCYIEGVCPSDVISLGELIQAGYIDEQVHPISKEFVNHDLNITCKDFTCQTDLK